MSLKVVKSLVCGLLIAQVSTVAHAAESKVAADALAKCAAQTGLANASCVVAANTQLVERRLKAEKSLEALFSSCQTKIAALAAPQRKQLAAVASYCSQAAAANQASKKIAAIESTLKFQQDLTAFVASQTYVSKALEAKVASQKSAIKVNAAAIETVEANLSAASASIKPSYKNIAKKNF